MQNSPPAERSSAEFDLRRVICRRDELSDPGALEFALGPGDWPLRGFVVRCGEILRAYVNFCPHAGFPLNWRPHEFLAPGAPMILCSMHGALFEIDDGRCVAGPCEGLALHPIPLQVDDDYVRVAPEFPLEEPADLGR